MLSKHKSDTTSQKSLSDDTKRQQGNIQLTHMTIAQLLFY